MNLSEKTIVITGATAGIGEATALLLSQAGVGRLVLAGRRRERLEALKSKIESEGATKVALLEMDVRSLEAVREGFASLPQSFAQVDVLINNAGLAAGLDPFQDALMEDWERMIDTNLKGLLYVSKALLPKMLERSKGHIINIASIAGKEVYPCGNVYCATKHAVDALTRSMRLDLAPKGIKVSSVAPGAVETEFSLVRFHGDASRANRVYEGFVPLSAQDVAETILYMISAPEHVNIADVLLLPSAQADSRNIHKEL